jgi:hypothetical protein
MASRDAAQLLIDTEARSIEAIGDASCGTALFWADPRQPEGVALLNGFTAMPLSLSACLTPRPISTAPGVSP